MPAIPPPRVEGTTTRTGEPLYWCRYGPAGAPPLVVLHGGPGAHHDYLLPGLLFLAESHDCLFYDQRGGGRSRTEDRSPVTWQVQVADLAAVLGELTDGAPPVLVGYSWGAMLAMLYATEAAAGRAGPAPRALVLLSPAPVSRAWRATFESEFARRQQAPALQAARAALQAPGVREASPDAHRQRAFELSVAGYFADPARARDLTPFRVTGRVQQEVWGSLGEGFDLRPQLAAVRLPTLVVHGRQDPIPLASAEAAAHALGATFVALEDCGHVPYVEQPAALRDAVLPFLRSLSPAGGP